MRRLAICFFNSPKSNQPLSLGRGLSSAFATLRPPQPLDPGTVPTATCPVPFCSRPDTLFAEGQKAGGALPSRRYAGGRIALIFTFILLHSAFILRASGQSYTIDWYKVAGGGGTSTGGVYSVSGTIGQHDVSGAMTSGNFSLTGGFWSLYAVQTPGAPVLSIKLTTTNTAQVYWPSPSTGFNLQVSTNLATTNWITPAESVTDNGTIKFIIVNPPAGNRYYRLKNP